jgi:NAD-dependent deacetylase
MTELMDKAKGALARAERLFVLTGAGISAESGIPTFRGDDGLWRSHRAEELATPYAFARDPELVWEFYDWRRGIISGKEPNAGHRALAELEKRVPAFALVTQNVDGLHRKAGSESLIEIHGSIWRVRCTGCGTESENYDVPIEILPKCRVCDGLLRPAVVWFGESLPQTALTQAFRAASECDLALVVGTSGIVQPAASLASEAKRAGATVIEVNLDETPNTGWVDIALLGKAGEILPRLLEW